MASNHEDSKQHRQGHSKTEVINNEGSINDTT